MTASEPVDAAEPILDVQELYKFFGRDAARFAVVREVSFRVPRGRFVTIMGPSGSGKSTLLHMVSGLEPPSGGRVLLDGHDLWALKEKQRTLLRRDTVGFVFQFYNLIPNLNVSENVRLPLLIGAGSGAGAPPGAGAAGDQAALDPDDALAELLATFSLQGKERSYPYQLSGGEMQRVSIARALIARPAILMADEPTGNISSSAGQEVMELFRRSCDERGQTILLVTHNARDAAYSDEVHFLKDGELHEPQRLQGDGVTPANIAASLAALGI